jgi:hypothetical protein
MAHVSFKPAITLMGHFIADEAFSALKRPLSPVVEAAGVEGPSEQRGLALGNQYPEAT